MKISKLIYRLFFKPTLPIRYHLKHFGLIGWANYLIGESQMKKAAVEFSPTQLSTNANTITFNFLTGKNYWHQTIFAIKSLSRQMPGEFRVKIYSDGSLQDQHINKLLKLGPAVEIVSIECVNQYLDKVLPQDKFPALRFLRNWHPFFRKMIDIHCSQGWSIYLDSDMLFFEKPIKLLEAFNTKQAIYMEEAMDESFYVDTETALKDRYNIDCLKRVNGGIIAYSNDEVDYEDLEEKAQIMIENYLGEGPAKIEQTLISYLLYKQGAEALDTKQYAIFYDSSIPDINTPVVKHYIFKAKFPYFTAEWKKIIH